jgi:2'-5' RNA ligase
MPTTQVAPLISHEPRMLLKTIRALTRPRGLNPMPSASPAGRVSCAHDDCSHDLAHAASGTTCDQLAAAIDKLAADHDALRFQPHVTVLVTLDAARDAAARKLASLVTDMPPVELTFTAIGHEETYFRSLYLHAAPSAQLQALQEAGRQAFALDRLPPAPHLSLLYSDMTEDCKRPIIADLGVSLPLTACFDAIELW